MIELNLLNEKPLNRYINNEFFIDEFQIGKILIFVEYPKDKPIDEFVQKAQSQLKEVWQDMDNAVLFAENILKNQYPNAFKEFDENQCTDRLLAVYSIRFDINVVVYDIGENYDWDTEYQMPDFPDDWFVQIKRVSPNHFEVADKKLIWGER